MCYVSTSTNIANFHSAASCNVETSLSLAQLALLGYGAGLPSRSHEEGALPVIDARPPREEGTQSVGGRDLSSSPLLQNNLASIGLASGVFTHSLSL
jgi:hypothetical protein